MNRLGQGLPRPSDLWSQDWPTLSLESVLAPPDTVAARAPDAITIDDFERDLLSLLKRNQPQDADNLAALCGALAKDADGRRAHGGHRHPGEDEGHGPREQRCGHQPHGQRRRHQLEQQGHEIEGLL